MAERDELDPAKRNAPSRPSRGVWPILPLLALLAAVAFLAIRINKGLYLGDEGVSCMSAWRIAQGQTPVADFFEIETPLSRYALAGAFKVLGPTVLASRLMGLVYGILLLALTWWVSGIFLRHPGPRALVLALMIPFGVGAWPFASHHWAVDLCLLAALGALARGCDDPRAVWPALGGACAAAGALCLQDQGGYAILLVSAAVLPALPVSRRLRFAAAWMGGISVVGLSMLAVLMLGGATVPGMIRDWVLFPSTRYSGLQGSMWEAAGGWSEIFFDLSAAKFQASPLYLPLTLLAYAILFLLPFAALPAGVLCVRFRWFGLPKSLLLAMVSLAFLGAAAHRWAIMNLVWAAPVPAILAAAWLDQRWDAPNGFARFAARTTAGGCLAVFLAFGAAGAVRQTRSTSYPIAGQAGVVHTFDPVQARALQDFVDAIRTTVPEGAPAFSWGYIPLVNFLTGHPNPTRWNIFITSPPYNSPGQVEEWMRTLRETPVKWGFSHAFPRDRDDAVAPFVSAHYRPVWSNGAYTLWQRPLDP